MERREKLIEAEYELKEKEICANCYNYSYEDYCEKLNECDIEPHGYCKYYCGCL